MDYIKQLPFISVPNAQLLQADPLSGMYRYQVGDRLINLLLEHQKFSLLENNQRIGEITFETTAKGEIWKGPTLLGKYERLRERYVITPYEQGLSISTKIELGVHPLDYLLRFC